MEGSLRRRLHPAVHGDHKRRSGISLVEVMVALVILGIGILGTTAGQLAAIKLSSDSRVHSEAMYLAEQKLEEFKRMPSADVAALAGTTTDPANPIDPAGDGVMSLDRSWTITDDSPEAGVMTVQVDVAWTNSLGVVRTATVQTLKVDL